MQKILGFTDWLGVSLTLLGDAEEPPEGHQWKCEKNGTNVWNSRRILYTEDAQKVFTLLSSPKSTIIPANAALLEVANEWLYHGLGWAGVQNLLTQCVPCAPTGLSRLDLCIDFNPDEHQRQVIEGLADGSMYVQGKRSGSSFWSINNDKWMPSMWVGRKIPHCQSWGHKTSSVKWKLYYKSKELRDGCSGLGWSKPYIVDAWRMAGLDELNVWRLEVSIKGGNTLLWNGQPISLELWYRNTLNITRTFYHDRFVVRMNEGHKDRTNDTVVPFLNLDTLSSVRCKTYDHSTPRSGRITLLRHLVSSLDDDEVLLDAASRDDVLTHVYSIVQRDGLSNYFKGMVGMYLNEWVEDVLQRSQNAGRVELQRNLLINSGLGPNTTYEPSEEEQMQWSANPT